VEKIIKLRNNFIKFSNPDRDSFKEIFPIVNIINHIKLNKLSNNKNTYLASQFPKLPSGVGAA